MSELISLMYKELLQINKNKTITVSGDNSPWVSCISAETLTAFVQMVLSRISFSEQP